MTVIFSDPLTSQSLIESKGAAMEFHAGRTNTSQFDAESGYSPGRGGRIELTGCLESGEKAALATAGTITLKISKNALATTDAQASSFTQSLGQANSNNVFLISCYPEAGTSAGRMQLGKHSNGNLTLFRADGSNSDLNTGAGITTVGKNDYIEIKLTWTNSGGTADIWIDGLKRLTRTTTMDFTATATSIFDNILIGGDSNRGIDDAGGNDIWIKDITVEDVYYNPVAAYEIAVTGDSFVVAGNSATGPQYDAGFCEVIEQKFCHEYGLPVNLTSYAASGDGYSYGIDDTDNLTSEFETAIAADPDILLICASVNDLQNDGSGSGLIDDYYATFKSMLDRAIANGNIKLIALTSVLPWTQAYDSANATGNAEYRKSKTAEANAILKSFRGYKGRVIYIDAFSKVGGFNYSVEYTIASATGTNDDADIHPTPTGHYAIGSTIATEIKRLGFAASGSGSGPIGRVIGRAIG